VELLALDSGGEARKERAADAARQAAEDPEAARRRRGRAIADWLAGAGVTELLVVHDHDPYYGCLAVVDGELVSA
jgi:hypothetical protein